MILSANTCVRALNIAAINRKTAFQVELAVGLAVFHAHGSSDKEARDMLYGAYNSAGYDCLRANGMDYKTVNRRINATAKLFERLPVEAWAGNHDEERLLSALCIGLEPYEFFTVQDVMRFCSPQRVLPDRPKLAITPAPDAIIPPTGTGHAAIRDMFRRASDQPGRRVEVGRLVLVIPDDAGREELIAMARRLLDLANELLTT